MTPAGVFVCVTGAYLRPVAVTFNQELSWRLGNLIAQDTAMGVWTDSLDTDGAVIPRWDFRG